MLNNRPDAAELLELLDFHPPNWRSYYEELWARYPTLTRDWVNPGFLNLPVTWPLEGRDLELHVRRRLESLNQQSRDSWILGEIRGKALALMAKRGADRVRAQRALDQRLAELGLRPIFRGGTRIPRSERPAMRTRYKEFRSLIDELRTAAAEGDSDDPTYRLALLIRFPLLSKHDIDMIFRLPYPRRGATAAAALAVLARRFNTRPGTLDRYLFPR
jgi:hypothetical protein